MQNSLCIPVFSQELGSLVGSSLRLEKIFSQLGSEVRTEDRNDRDETLQKPLNGVWRAEWVLWPHLDSVCGREITAGQDPWSETRPFPAGSSNQWR